MRLGYPIYNAISVVLIWIFKIIANKRNHSYSFGNFADINNPNFSILCIAIDATPYT